MQEDEIHFYYDKERLLKRLLLDIRNNGDFEVLAYSRKVNGKSIYIDYDFLLPEDTGVRPLQVGETVEKMMAKQLGQKLFGQTLFQK